MDTGISFAGNLTVFRVWAPEKGKVTVKIVFPEEHEYEMEPLGDGYHQLKLNKIVPGTKYLFGIDGGYFPDPASHSQPEGVHGPSEVVDHNEFTWHDSDWHGLPFGQLVIYELHVGTFTPEGTFKAIISRLDDLLSLGINAIELMPVAQFPGKRNWGYDGVYPYAVQSSYGGSDGLKTLVDACHQKGISVFLDVVYNHLGPEGNYLKKYGPYFSQKYTTPWGEALNLDAKWCDGVRAFVVDNMQHWFEHYHIDGLRCDAIHEIYDSSALHIWEEANARIEALRTKHGRLFHLIAECDTNNPKVVMPISLGGMGFRAQWLDDFHHSVYNLLDPSAGQRYDGFGTIAHLAKAFDEGFVHSGEFVDVRKKKHGASSAAISPDHFVVFSDNHDQTGNRPNGERMASMLNLSQLKLACAPALLSCYVPMLFMGEEYGELSPFHYFVDHSDQQLLKAVREGRRKEFEYINGDMKPADPGAASTFEQSRLCWQNRLLPKGRALLAWYQKLISLRSALPALRTAQRRFQRTNILADRCLELVRTDSSGEQTVICLFNFDTSQIAYRVGRGMSEIEQVFDSNDPAFCTEEEEQTFRIEKYTVGETVLLQPLSVYVFIGNTAG